MKNIVKFISIFALLVAKSGFAENTFNLNNINYTETELNIFLSTTENIRTSNTELFNSNLISLKNLKKTGKLSSYQNCYISYLHNYQIAFSGNYENAKINLINIFKSCNEIELKIKSKALLANLNVISKDYEIAINNIDFVISNIDSVKDINLKHNIYSTTALIYRLVKQYDLSLMFSNLLLDDNPNDDYKCRGLSNKYRIFVDQNYKGQFDREIEETISFCGKTGEVIHKNFLYLEWLDFKSRDVNADDVEIRKIFDDIKLAEIEIENAKYQNLISVKDSMLAKIYWELGEYNKAAEYANISLEGSKSIGSTKQKIDSLQILVNYHQNKGEFEKAIGYLKEKSDSEKLQYTDQQAKAMAFQTIKHENLAKTHKIVSLNQENKVLLLENELSEKSALVQKLSIMFLMLLVAFFILWGFKNKKEQKVYKRLSETDHMTLIYNRKGLKDYMEYLLPFSQNNKQVVGYAIFDLDLFKNINDTYGHMTGDWVIKNVIKTCSKNMPDDITLGRIGGEEFAIVYRNSTVEELHNYCEECRVAISKLDTQKSGHDFKVTASFGVTSTQISGFVYSALMSNADVALYKAKENGRNNTVIYQPS